MSQLGTQRNESHSLLPGAHAWSRRGEEHETAKPTGEAQGMSIWHIGGGIREGLLR